jgi:hypothetical protein
MQEEGGVIMKPVPIEALVEVLGYLHNIECYRDPGALDSGGTHNVYDHVQVLLHWIASNYADGPVRDFAFECIGSYELNWNCT